MRYITTVLQKGSIAKAAKALNISQSSVVSAIDQAEADLGQPMFRRIPAKGLLATEFGRTVGERLEKFLDEARVLDSDLRGLTGRPGGLLRIGCYAPAAPHVLPTILKALRADYPDIRIDLREGDMQRINDMLTDGEVDVALTYRRQTSDRLPFEPLFRAPPWALLPYPSKLAEQDCVTLAELAELPMVLLDLPGTNAYFRKLFEDNGLDLDIAHSTKSSFVLRGLVAADFGFSILNICGVHDRDGAGGYIARPICGKLDSPLFGVAYSLTAERSALVQSVLSTCRDVVESGTLQPLVTQDQA
ncbi:transcriptional regulator, LysR family [Tropicibacter naphthalenivorans]|uniref:HTH-type transcriptional regulator cbl n=2 Tax=Tropicibacter naphthalenivorans TaxID=441103 RepID=A0A0P1GGV6_9RHOB|nr:LysR substrate-binding domain-containing protein [Tropicibacter naphthalenivorans]CUH74901.1 HTH-type transcriptional regulator cbl [Tropicibacter naphthalenivorans]SMC48207.1 transcriptional regulator, LysR family [Tropicibacter naphthalenivorans]